MLESKVIIYDDSCPMCKLYTYWFVAWGFLLPRIGLDSRPLRRTSRHMSILIADGTRSRCLIEPPKKRFMASAALTYVLGSRWTWLKPFFESRVFMWMFYPLYQIITYNRRVIAGCQACCGFDCAPDLNRFYRSVYLLIAGVVICSIGGSLLTHGSVAGALNPFTTTVWLTIAFIFVGAVIAIFKRATDGSTATWDFLGNHATSILIFALATIPLLMWPQMHTGIAWVNVLAATMLGFEEIQRRS